MTAKQGNPHDSLFRKIMSNPAAAAGEFRAVMPEWLVALIDWEGMELAPSRYVLPNLRNRDSDILFKATVGGRDGYIHLLLEHQSTPDKHMPLRVLEYMIGTWTQHLNDQPGSAYYPLVIPVVVNSGPNTWRWNYTTELWDRIGADPAIRAQLGDLVPRFRIIVDDLAGLEFSDLYARELAPAVLMMLILHRLAFKNEHLDRDLQPHIEVLRAVEDSPNATNDLFSLFTYISKVSETNARDLGRLVDQLGPLAKEVAMTTAEQLRAEGQTKGQAKLILRQLTVKFGPLAAEVADRVQAGSAAELETWAERVVTATTLDEFFA
ncbi:Rpn family recombination-promoting nuclease/putative transposase [Nocardia aobensis]|uniref:Rpn family recombination-promoting nuclease/putative transposase n=1 Tax=Nocardia aobensis TaxID=257277 RepID=UPI000A05A67E|nr:Rpn family recombination-promoting nuclease/putative transposase [Nocardia aobensis]